MFSHKHYKCWQKNESYVCDLVETSGTYNFFWQILHLYFISLSIFSFNSDLNIKILSFIQVALHVVLIGKCLVATLTNHFLTMNLQFVISQQPCRWKFFWTDCTSMFFFFMFHKMFMKGLLWHLCKVPPTSFTLFWFWRHLWY